MFGDIVRKINMTAFTSTNIQGPIRMVESVFIFQKKKTEFERRVRFVLTPGY